MIQTIELLRSMKLNGFIAGIKEQQDSALYRDLSFEERIAHLVDKEYLLRRNRKIQRNISSARFRQNASIEELDFNTRRGLSKSTIAAFDKEQWLNAGNNLIITGPTGVGKTFLACALGNSVCRKGYNVKYEKSSALLSALHTAQLEGSLYKVIKQLTKVKLLILDEWLRDRLNPTHARVMLDIIDERYNRASTVFVSQFPTDKWHQLIDDPTIADAILDRILHNSNKLTLSGETMRKIMHNNTEQIESISDHS